MATFEPNVIDVQLLLGATAIEGAQFDIPLFLSSHNNFSERYRVYTSTAALEDDGFDVNGVVYQAATHMFNGVAKPSQIYVGKRSVDEWVITLPTAAAETYTVTFTDGAVDTDFTFTATIEDEATILGEIKDQIDASAFAAQVTAVVSISTLTLTVTPDATFTVSVTANMSVTSTLESVTTALNDILEETNAFFWVAQDSHTEVDVLAAAAWAETNRKIFVWSSQDTGIRDNTLNNTLQKVAELAYNNTCFAMWAPDADTTVPEAAVIGAYASTIPGTSTMHGKTLVGITPNKLSDSQKVNIVTWNGNLYLRDKGVGFYRDGRMASGVFLDYMHYALYFASRVEESLFGLLKRKSDILSKVTMDEDGAALIAQALYDNPLNRDIANGAIFGDKNGLIQNSDGSSSDLRPKIIIPDRSQITADDLANRTWRDLLVEVVYRTPVHYIKIRAGVILDR
jgi:hypothetical protein